MSAEVLTATLLLELEKHRLLDPAQLRELHKLQGTLGTDGKLLAGELLRRGWLTPFQVNRLLQGRGDALVLGPYLLLERRGEGGMGQVFKARHTLLDRIVALKVIRTERLNHPESLDRFRREMQAAAKLVHPNVVLAHDANRVGDAYYLAMEYIDGADLRELLKQCGRLPLSQACDCVRQAALGLQHAHERGLVHRDIKPSNLMLASSGNVVKVLDLGLARLRTSVEQDATTSDLTSEGSMMGTPDYIAPEQAIDSHSADIRSDIYSLGCTLYHLLAGRPPFPGGSLTEKLLRHQQAEPQAIESLVEVPDGLARVIRRLMAKKPQDRYQTPQEVADALTPFASAALVSCPAPRIERPAVPTGEETTPAGTATVNDSIAGARTIPLHRKPNRQRFLVLGALVGCPAVFAIIFGACLIRWHWLSASNPPGPTQGGGGAPAGTEAHDAADDNTDIANGGQAIEAGKLAPMAADGPAQLINHLKGHTALIQCLAFSADGKQLASGGDDNQVRLWDGRTGDGRGTPLRHGAPVPALAFSPDGKYLAAASYDGGYDASIKLWNLDFNKSVRTLSWKDRTGTPSLAAVHGLSFSADGKKLASGGGPLRLWSLDGVGEPVVLTWQKLFPTYLYGVAFSPDGKTVAAGCHETGDNVRLWEVNAPGDPIILQGNKQAFGISHSDVRGVIAYAGGGKLLVRVTSDGLGGLRGSTASVMLWDVDAGKQQLTWRETFTIPGGTVFALVGAADGHLRVAVAAGSPGLGGISRSELEPDEVRVWDGAARKVRAFRTLHKRDITALAFSPDGSRLATGSADQSVKLWDLTR